MSSTLSTSPSNSIMSPLSSSSSSAPSAYSSLVLPYLQSLFQNDKLSSVRRSGNSTSSSNETTITMASSSVRTKTTVVIDRLLGSIFAVGLSLAIVRLSVRFWKWYKYSGSRRKCCCRRRRLNCVILRTFLTAFGIDLVFDGGKECERDDLDDGIDEIEEEEEEEGEHSESSESEMATATALSNFEFENRDDYDECDAAGVDGDLDGKKEEQNFGTHHSLYGSCHCQVVRFVVLRTRREERTLLLKKRRRKRTKKSVFDGRRKINFPRLHLTSASSDFEMLTDINLLRIYRTRGKRGAMKKKKLQEEEEENDDDKILEVKEAAHAFCSQCGVHVFHIPDCNGDALEVNADCIDFNDRSCHDEVDGGKRTISIGVPNRMASTTPIAGNATPIIETIGAFHVKGKASSSSFSSFASSSNNATPLTGSRKESGSNASTPVTETTTASGSLWEGSSNESFGSDYRTITTATASISAQRDTVVKHSMLSTVPQAPLAILEKGSVSVHGHQAARRHHHNTATTSPTKAPPSSSLSVSSVRLPHSGNSKSLIDPRVREQLTYYMRRHLPAHTQTALAQSPSEPVQTETQARTSSPTFVPSPTPTPMPPQT